MQKQRLIILIVGIILGLVAVFMVKAYIAERAEEVRKQAAQTLEKMRQNQVAVLIARQDIPANTVIQASMFEPSIVPREYAQPQTATSSDAISGMTTLAPISRGEQISLGKLASGAQSSRRRDLASITPVGKRAVTVRVDNISEVASLIKPGSMIDLIAVLPMQQKGQEGKKDVQQTIFPAFQNVLLLAVGQEVDPNLPQAAKQKDKVEQVTVALDPTEANILAFIQDQGKIRIFLRSANDSQIENVKPVTWESVLDLMPSLKPEEDRRETIEIYRGLNKERIVISE